MYPGDDRDSKNSFELDKNNLYNITDKNKNIHDQMEELPKTKKIFKNNSNNYQTENYKNNSFDKPNFIDINSNVNLYNNSTPSSNSDKLPLLIVANTNIPSKTKNYHDFNLNQDDHLDNNQQNFLNQTIEHLKKEHDCSKSNSSSLNSNINEENNKINPNPDEEKIPESLKYIEKLINKTGFNNYFILNFLTTGLFFFSEGAQIFTITILNPIFKQIFDKNVYGDFLISFISSSFYLGYFLGSFFSSIISKHFNRKKPIIVTNIIIIIFCFLYICWENIYYLITLKVVIGASYGIGIPLIFTNFGETIPSKKRGIAICSIRLFFCLGSFYSILLFKLIVPNFEKEKWKILYIFHVIPNVLIPIMTYFFLKESPKLYHHKKDIDSAAKILIQMNNNYRNSEQIIEKDEIHKLKKIFYMEYYCVNMHKNEEFFVEPKINNEDVNYLEKNEVSLESSKKNKIEKDIKFPALKSKKSMIKTDLMLKKEAELQNLSQENFSLYKIFEKKYLPLTLIALPLFAIIGMVTQSSTYYLPIAMYQKSLISQKLLKINTYNSNTFSLTKSETLPAIDIQSGNSSSNTPKIEDNFSLIFFVSQLGTLFGIFLGIILSKHLTRKFLILITFIPCLICAIVCSFTPEGIFPCMSILNLLIVIPFMINMLFIVEAYPTNLRDGALSLAYMIKRFSEIVVPFAINSLINVSLLAPVYFMVGISLIGAILSAILPKDYDGLKIY